MGIVCVSKEEPIEVACPQKQYIVSLTSLCNIIKQ